MPAQLWSPSSSCAKKNAPEQKQNILAHNGRVFMFRKNAGALATRRRAHSFSTYTMQSHENKVVRPLSFEVYLHPAEP
jgi:hypothetical protein